MVPFSPEEKRSVDQDAATAIHLTATPFPTLRNSYFHKFLHWLDPAYTPPSRDQISGALLDEAYNKVSTEVNKVLQRQQQLHIIMDEGDDISGNRIINMCILTSYAAFHYCTEFTGWMLHTAETLANWALVQMEQIVGSDWRLAISYIFQIHIRPCEVCGRFRKRTHEYLMSCLFHATCMDYSSWLKTFAISSPTNRS